MATKKPASAGKKTAPTKRKSAPVAKKPTTTKVTSRAASVSSRAYFTTVTNFMKAPLMAASVAEFIGTFVLTAIALIVWNADPNYTLFTVVPIVLLVVMMSGAHLNPVITFGALATRRVNLARAAAYIVAQVLGALVAFAMMTGFVNAVPEAAAGAMQSSPSLFKAAEIPKASEWLIVSTELLGATIFAFAVASALKHGKTGVAYALTYAGGLYVALILARTVASYVSGTAILNPALAGPFQALSWQLWPILVYVVTPLVGGILGFGLNDLLQKKEVVTVK